MATAPFANVYTRRQVAESSAKGCDICYKPSTTVLITPEKQDFFYVCAAHLTDRSFCSPIIDEAAVEAKKKREEEAKKKKELEEEIERVKKEYAEKQKKKKEMEKEKDKDKDKDKDAKDKDKTEDDDKKKDDTAEKTETSPKPEEDDPVEEPRIFALQRTFYQMRVDKKRQADIARRNRERLQNPNFFPSVPKGLP